MQLLLLSLANGFLLSMSRLDTPSPGYNNGRGGGIGRKYTRCKYSQSSNYKLRLT